MSKPVGYTPVIMHRTTDMNEAKRRIVEMLTTRGEHYLSEIRIGSSKEVLMNAIAELQAEGKIEALCMGRRSGLGYRIFVEEKA